ncbi:hepatopoietin protein, partial [Phyllosticta capitalensis]
MPLTFGEYPILSRFLCAVEKNTGEPAQPETTAMDNNNTTTTGRRDDDHTPTAAAGADGPKKFPKGVVLGADGKPCRSCTSFASWAAITKSQTKGASAGTTTGTAVPSTFSSQPSPPADCPPDVEALGRSTWTLLHSITATYPTAPTASQQDNARGFLRSFASLYPCWVCAEDFQDWMKTNTPRVSSRDEFGRWMCEAHNAVNVKLGKDVFECSRWEERWRTGWKDGRCD